MIDIRPKLKDTARQHPKEITYKNNPCTQLLIIYRIFRKITGVFCHVSRFFDAPCNFGADTLLDATLLKMQRGGNEHRRAGLFQNTRPYLARVIS